MVWNTKIMRFPKELTTVTPLSKILATVLFIFLPILSFMYGYLLTQKSFTDNTNFQFNSYITNEKSNKNVLHTVNIHSSDNPFLTFQVKFPSSYLVTSDDMVTYYKTQGGRAHPRLIFTKDTQPLKTSVNNYEYLELLKSNVDCIMVYSTKGISTIDDWEKIVYPLRIVENGILEEKQNTIEIISVKDTYIGSFNGTVREIKDSIYPQRFEAFVKMPKDQVTYFFHTCTINNKDDFYTVLANFDVRGNLNQ